MDFSMVHAVILFAKETAGCTFEPSHSGDGTYLSIRQIVPNLALPCKEGDGKGELTFDEGYKKELQEAYGADRFILRATRCPEGMKLFSSVHWDNVSPQELERIVDEGMALVEKSQELERQLKAPKAAASGPRRSDHKPRRQYRDRRRGEGERALQSSEVGAVDCLPED